VFRRGRKGEPDDAVDIDDAADDSTGATDDEAPASTTEADRPQGPWDAADAPDDGVHRLDLGAIQVLVSEGMELRLEAQEQLVVSATLVDGHSMLQIHAFAAPRRSGIWPEVRSEIANSLCEAGGEAEDGTGPFGTELKARIPVEAPGHGPSLQATRFLGVDGPRWFLRGMVTGPAATDPVQAKRLEDTFRGTVVVRGTDAMAPRELLPLRLPREAVEQMDTPEPGRPGLEMLERGPEITETQ